MTVALSDGALVATLGDGLTFPTVKLTECIYSVKVNYAASALTVMTGPPGVDDDVTKQRCWLLSKSDNAVSFTRNEAGASCPASVGATAAWAGTISSFTAATKDVPLPTRFGPACSGLMENAALELLSGTSASGPGFWLQPAFAAFTRSVPESLGSGSAVVQQCTRRVSGVTPDSSGKFVVANLFVSTQTGDACTGDACYVCIHAKLAPFSGLITVEQSSSNVCVSSFGVNSAVFSVSIVTAPTVLTAPTTAAPASVSASTLTVQNRTVVRTTLSLAGTFPVGFDIAAAADSCNIYGVRAQLASNMGVSVGTVQLTSMTYNGASVTLSASSPGNLLAAACPASAARRLGLSGRALQVTTLSAGVQVVAPAGSSAAAITALSTSVANAAITVTSIPTVAVTLTPSASTPVSSTAAVLTAPVYPPRIKPYVPSSDIVMFHAIPRAALPIGPFADGAAPTNNFSTDLSYFGGAVAPGAAIIAFGIVFYVLYNFIYVCSCFCRPCCKRCYPKRDPDVYYVGCRKTCGTGRAMIVMSLLNIALILSVIGYLPRFADGIDTLFGAAQDFSNVLSTTGDLMSSATQVSYADGTLGKSMFNATTAANTAAISLLAQMTGGATPQAATDLVIALRDGSGTAASLSGAVGVVLKSGGVALTDALSAVSVATIKQYVTLAGYAVLGALSFLLLSFSLLICKNPCASCMYKLLAPLIILLFLILCILTGLFYVVGIVGADVCADPATTILDAIKGASGLDTITYYLTCGNNPGMTPVGAYVLVTGAQDQINLAATQATSLRDTVMADQTNAAYARILSPINTLLPDVATNMVNAASAVATIASTTVSCQTIDAILSRLFSGLCNDGFGTMIAIFRILLVRARFSSCKVITRCAHAPPSSLPPFRPHACCSRSSWASA